MSKCLLSVIVPVYNAERTIDRCISSIVNSGTGSFEIILVNDGSTDQSLAHCRKWAASHDCIRVLTKRNRGVSAARNCGLAEAQGEYVTFVDSDDCVSNTYIGTILKQIESKQDLYIFKSMEVRSGISADRNTWIMQSGPVDKALVCDRLTKGYLNVPWDKVFRRELITAHRIRFEECVSIGEDWIFSMTYAGIAERFCLISETLYYYIITEGSLTRRSIRLDQLDNSFFLFEKLIAFAESTDQDLSAAYAMCLQILTNTCGKLVKSGCKKRDIRQYFAQTTLYKQLVCYPCRDIRSWIRVLCLRLKLYSLMAVVFDGD